MIFVDKPRQWNNRRKLYSHMISDTSIKDLHEFAKVCGIKKHWFHKNHYDLREHEYLVAVDLGATVISTKEIVRILKKLLDKNT